MRAHTGRAGGAPVRDGGQQYRASAPDQPFDVLAHAGGAAADDDLATASHCGPDAVEPPSSRPWRGAHRRRPTRAARRTTRGSGRRSAICVLRRGQPRASGAPRLRGAAGVHRRRQPRAQRGWRCRRSCAITWWAHPRAPARRARRLRASSAMRPRRGRRGRPASSCRAPASERARRAVGGEAAAGAGALLAEGVAAGALSRQEAHAVVEPRATPRASRILSAPRLRTRNTRRARTCSAARRGAGGARGAARGDGGGAATRSTRSAWRRCSLARSGAHHGPHCASPRSRASSRPPPRRGAAAPARPFGKRRGGGARLERALRRAGALRRHDRGASRAALPHAGRPASATRCTRRSWRSQARPRAPRASAGCSATRRARSTPIEDRPSSPPCWAARRAV